MNINKKITQKGIISLSRQANGWNKYKINKLIFYVQFDKEFLKEVSRDVRLRFGNKSNLWKSAKKWEKFKGIAKRNNRLIFK